MYIVLIYWNMFLQCFLIYIGPFEWHHTCIPVLSACELDTCKGSESFIVGCKKNRSLPSDVVSNVSKLWCCVSVHMCVCVVCMYMCMYMHVCVTVCVHVRSVYLYAYV